MVTMKRTHSMVVYLNDCQLRDIVDDDLLVERGGRNQPLSRKVGECGHCECV